MNKIIKVLPSLIALAVGGYLGYFFTNNHYLQKEAKENKTEYTAICRLELRDGNNGDVKEKYIALLEYRNVTGGKEFCQEHTPTKYLPDDTHGTSLNSLESEEGYNEQVQIDQ